MNEWIINSISQSLHANEIVAYSNEIPKSSVDNYKVY